MVFAKPASKAEPALCPRGADINPPFEMGVCNLTVMADLNKVSVMEAWNGEAFTSFRSRYLNKDFEGTLCYNCLFHKNATVIPVNSEATVYVDDKRKKEELNDRIIQLDKIYQEDSKA